MNCPNCRRHLWYERELSNPTAKNKDRLSTYYCASCSTLWIFKPFPTKVARGGYSVVKVANIKEAGFRPFNDSINAPRRGEAKK